MTTARALSRRQAFRLFGGAALAAVPALRLAGEAAAGRSWCRADPTFLVDGLLVNVFVAGELDKTYDTTGPIQLRFISPTGTDVQMLYSDLGFGQGYDITYAQTDKLKNDDKEIEIAVEVVVPAVSELRVRVEFVPDGTVEFSDAKEGKTNRTITVKTKLRKPRLRR